LYFLYEQSNIQIDGKKTPVKNDTDIEGKEDKKSSFSFYEDKLSAMLS